MIILIRQQEVNKLIKNIKYNTKENMKAVLSQGTTAWCGALV